MIRTALVAALVLLSAAGTSRADTLPLIGLPSGYTPGVPISFDVFAPGLSGLTDYTLQFTVTAGLPPNLPDLTVSATAPVGLAGYPFPDASNFNATVTSVAGVNSFNVTITDATSGAGVNTILGSNDRLATVTITPGVNLSGPITVQFTQNDFTTARDVGFELPGTATIDQLPSTPAVPAPPSLVLLALGGLCFAGRQFFARPKAEARLV